MKYKIFDRNNTCRVCQSHDLQKILHLEEMPFTDDFLTEDKIGTTFLHPIDIFVCENCKTTQTQHDVDFHEYYEDYQYSVGSSGFASTFMHNIAEKLCKTYFPNEKNIKVLEVGSGDGEQLVPFKNLGCEVLGYEPSSYLIEVASKKGIQSIQGLFDENAINTLPEEFKKVNIIFLSYTFDHIPDPVGFLKAAHSILDKENGIIVIENHDLEKIFDRQEYCLFEHEHSIYLTKNTTISLAKRNNLEVVEFDVLPENQRRANSLIFVLTSNQSKWAKNAITNLNLDKKYEELSFYKQQADIIYQSITNFENFIDTTVSLGKSIAGYGAGGRGVMTLAALKNAHKLKYIVDKKPKKSGVFTPKSNLPVYTIDQLQIEPVDIVIVFSFGYMDEIKKDLKLMGYQESQIISMLTILKDESEISLPSNDVNKELPQFDAGLYKKEEGLVFNDLYTAFQKSSLSLAYKLQAFPVFVRRQDIATLLAKNEIFKQILNVNGSIVECGVFVGGGTMTWLHCSSIYEPYNHTRKIIGFDTFSGFPEIDKNDSTTGTSEHLHKGGLSTVNSMEEELSNLVVIHDANRPLGHIKKVELVSGDACITIPKYVEDNPHLLISLLYLDFDIYKPTEAALHHLYSRVVKGGIIAFDEANCKSYPGETIALLEVLDLSKVELKRFPFVTNLSYFVK